MDEYSSRGFEDRKPTSDIAAVTTKLILVRVSSLWRCEQLTLVKRLLSIDLYRAIGRVAAM